MKYIPKLIILFSLFLVVIPYLFVEAQTPTKIECGDVIEAELTSIEISNSYEIAAPAGTRLVGQVEPIGSTLNSTVNFSDSAGNQIGWFNNTVQGIAEEFDMITSSSNPIMEIWGVANDSTSGSGSHFARRGRTLGAYTLLLGCVLRDGTVIEPGDMLPHSTGSGGNSVVAAAPIFSGTGFPGLAPVDFANAFKLPLSLGTAMPGQIPPAGDSILGLTFDASAGDTFALDFARLSGNLNLGVVVLSANNEVVFQASLVTSQSLSTRLTLPSAGQYTIGVFRIDLLPPAAPEATQFQITGTLNP